MIIDDELFKNLEKGCGLWEIMSPSTECKEGNLCKDCTMIIKYYKLGFYNGYGKAFEHMIELKKRESETNATRAI